MKFLHTSDLHLGKTVNEFSMLEDQQFILNQMKGIAIANKVDAVILAGDIYDRAIPSGEAVSLLDAFLTEISEEGIQIIMISGNHDSPERISFGEGIMGKQGIGIAGVLREELSSVRLKRGEDETVFVLLPFVKPAQAGAKTSGEAVAKLLAAFWKKEKIQRVSQLGKKSFYVLVTHYFVTDNGTEPELSDSETTVHVGGIDNVDASLFEGFDYVALGHIHKPQQIGSRPIWYAGAPLAYSFGEVNQEKSVVLTEIQFTGEKEEAFLINRKKLLLNPVHRMRKVKGRLEEILEQALKENEHSRKDYIQATLTDEGEMIDPIGSLRSVYSNVMQVVREEKSLLSAGESETAMTERKETDMLFKEFYETVREKPLSPEGEALITNILMELS